jgi:hypothetical protein
MRIWERVIFIWNAKVVVVVVVVVVIVVVVVVVVIPQRI